MIYISIFFLSLFLFYTKLSQWKWCFCGGNIPDWRHPFDRWVGTQSQNKLEWLPYRELAFPCYSGRYTEYRSFRDLALFQTPIRKKKICCWQSWTFLPLSLLSLLARLFITRRSFFVAVAALSHSYYFPFIVRLIVILQRRPLGRLNSTSEWAVDPASS